MSSRTYRKGSPHPLRLFSDLSHWQLHRELGREGIALPYTTIEHMRCNPAYLGVRLNSKGELIKADWPAILDRDLWDKQQQRRLPKVIRRGSRAPGPAYLLSGMARCLSCGGPVTGRPLPPSRGGTPLFIYKCYKRPNCSTHGGQLPGWLVDLLVTDALTEYVKKAVKMSGMEAWRSAGRLSHALVRRR